MLWFSWNPWHTPAMSSTASGQSFPAVIGPAGGRDEATAAVRESGSKMAYVPVYIGWM